MLIALFTLESYLIEKIIPIEIDLAFPLAVQWQSILLDYVCGWICPWERWNENLKILFCELSVTLPAKEEKWQIRDQLIL